MSAVSASALLLALALGVGEAPAPSPVPAAAEPAAVSPPPAAAQHPAGAENVPTGIIPLEDNWGFVRLAYGVSGAGLVGYALSLWVRRPRTKVP